MGIPLLIHDQNETIIYMDNPDLENDISIIGKTETVKEDFETVLIKSEANSDIDVETVIINQEVVNETVMKDISEDVILTDNLICKDDMNIYNEVASDDSDVNDSKDVNTIVIENVGGEPVCLNGQMVQLLDGTTAFIENSKNGESDVYTPVKLYNGNVVYVMAGTLLNMANSTEDTASDTNEKSEENGSTEIKAEKTKGYQCSYKNCNKSYTSFHHLKVHLRVHTGDRPFQCNIDGCNKAFSTGFGLKTHFRTHNGERPYVCNHENCEKGFKTSGDLQKHIRTHTGERPFLCPIPNCGRSFTTCNICKVHVRTHTGERPYKCTYPNCNKTFASVTNQRNHMRIHSGEKPYVCSFEKCGRRFTEYSSLYKHNMVHRQQPHSCQICGKSYKQACGLMMHTKTAHGEPKETFLMVDKSPVEEISQPEEPTAIFLVDNIKFEGEESVLEDQLFSELREAAPLNV